MGRGKQLAQEIHPPHLLSRIKETIRLSFPFLWRFVSHWFLQRLLHDVFRRFSFRHLPAWLC